MNRLILTLDDDLFTQLNRDDTTGVFYQTDQTLSARDVGGVVHELSQYVDQSDVTLEFVSGNWLWIRRIAGSYGPQLQD